MNVYEILGVPVEATQSEIEQAYQRRLRQIDNLPDEDNAAIAFAAVYSAYSKLRQPAEVQLYVPPTKQTYQGRAHAQARGPQPVGRHQQAVQVTQHNHYYAAPQSQVQYANPLGEVNWSNVFTTWIVLLVTLGTMFAVLMHPR